MDDFETLLDKVRERTVPEVTEEFSNADGEMKLLKRKVVHKVVPSALWGGEADLDIVGLSDEELERELKRLKSELR